MGATRGSLRRRRWLACRNEHEATQSAIAASGAIEPLVALLDGSEGAEAQEAAAGAVLALAETVANRLTITEAAGSASWCSMLGCNNLMAREHAEGALVRLSIEPENRVQIIKKLVAMLQDPQAGGQEQAAAALANLARESEDNRKSIVDANGIDPLLELLGDSSSQGQGECGRRDQGALPQLQVEPDARRQGRWHRAPDGRAGGLQRQHIQGVDADLS